MEGKAPSLGPYLDRAFLRMRQGIFLRLLLLDRGSRIPEGLRQQMKARIRQHILQGMIDSGELTRNF